MRTVPEGQLVYGMQLPIQSQSALYTAQWERESGVDELVRITQTAERAGFFYAAVCDHVAIPSRLADGMGTTWYDTISTLGFLAGVTSSIKLMSHVWVLSYRHPLQSSKHFATLDHLSKGRVIIGVGAGHVQDEFDTLGVDYHRRGKLLDEAIDSLDVALRDEFVGDAGARPRPVQQPRPPIWVGGSSPAALKRAGERGEGWLPQGTPRAQMPEQIQTVLRHREAAGRADEPIDLGAITELVYVGDPSWDVGEHTLTGSPESIAESLREFGAMGANHLQIRFKARSLDEQLDQMERFGADVGPLLKS